MKRTIEYARECVRDVSSGVANPGLIALTFLCVACTPDMATSIDDSAEEVAVSEPRPARKPTGSQHCGLTGEEVFGISLQQDGEYSRLLARTDAIPLRVTKELDESGALTIEATVTSFELPDQSFAFDHFVAAGRRQVNVVLPLSRLSLPLYNGDVSRQLTIDATFATDDGSEYDAVGSVRLYFHAQGGGWRFYDEVVRDRDYSGGALTDAERAKRAAAMASLPPGVTAEYANARVTKISDDPDDISPDEADSEGGEP
jgi:hypothetical protein